MLVQTQSVEPARAPSSSAASAAVVAAARADAESVTGPSPNVTAPSQSVTYVTDLMADYRARPHVVQAHAAELERLTTLRLCARSPALARAIAQAVEVKQVAYQKGREHDRAEVLVQRLGSDADPAVVEAARATEIETDMAYQEALRQLDVAAALVANAPVGGLTDVMDRADAFAHVIGGLGKDGLPASDEDVEKLLGTYRTAVEEMYERGRVDHEDTFAAGLARYRTAEAKLSVLNQRWDDRFGTVVIVPKDAAPDLRRELAEVNAERDQARTLMFAGTPQDVGDLLALMEIAFDHIGSVDVGSYEMRDRIIGAEPVEERDMWQNDRQAHRRALALIARHAARLRDQSMPSDWRDLMETMSRIPNGRDAAWRAYDLGMDTANLTNIQLIGHPADQLPILMFQQPDGTHWIRPDAAFKGEVML